MEVTWMLYGRAEIKHIVMESVDFLSNGGLYGCLKGVSIFAGINTKATMFYDKPPSMCPA